MANPERRLRVPAAWRRPWRALRHGASILGAVAVLALAATLDAARMDGADGFALIGDAHAARESNVRATRHNLSAGSGNTVRATAQDQVCVFCHTPHGATIRDPNGNSVNTPLWNRTLSGATYTPYTSSSLDASVVQGTLDQPGGSSKLCLSCHDGTMAIGSVNVLNGQGSGAVTGGVSVNMTGTGTGGTMPTGAGTTSGFTRNLGVDLTNDHPISLTYSATLSSRDGELRTVDANQRYPATTGTVIGVRGAGYKPLLPLEPTGTNGVGQVQCGTCHDPHLNETNAATLGNQKFLRQNRFQQSQPTATLDTDRDIICLSCHEKMLGAGTWAYSAHANNQVATQTYTATAATQREFPANLPVWKAACMNCHDTHTVQGARRLLREGTDSAASPKTGGNPALEQTCYQCHTSSATAVVTPLTTVPNIQSDFTTKSRRMPIASGDQAAGSEVHAIGGNFNDVTFVDCSTTTNRCGADMVEQRTNLGVANLSNRHAECTDCHNPHRVVKFKSFLGNPAGSLSGTPDASGTHTHSDSSTDTTVHTNLASGVLRGGWGVEPVYGSASFHALPTSYVVKRGDPGASTDASASATYVTREYQICLKCHSDYGYSDNNTYPTGDRPSLGYTGGTPSGTNGLTQYTNQARELQAPSGHRGELTTADSGASGSYSTNNHRSWHPVMGSTGRTGSIRGNGTDISARWNYPWRNGVGTQTMYCTDCHGSEIASGTSSVIPTGGEDGNPWGPHGSSNNFILKGTWNTTTGTGQQNDGLCFKCHVYANYATASGSRTGFWNVKDDRGRDDLHQYHADKIGRMRCSWCHVAVPHGWKNKALLVNLNDVGPEAGLAAGTAIAQASLPYTKEPYYMNAYLKVRTFAPSGAWLENSCGSTTSSGRSWMQNTCNSPP